MAIGPLRGESVLSLTFRKAFNLWPCYFGTGGRVTFAAADWHEMHVELDLGARTRNRVGTIFGGSIYGSVNPWTRFFLPAEEIQEIRDATEEGRPVDRVYLVEYKDSAGDVCAMIEKTLYIRRKKAT